VWANLLPSGDRLTHNAINRLREGSAGLVHGNIKETHRVGDESFIGDRNGDIVSLPADTADAEAPDLVIGYSLGIAEREKLTLSFT
jgi:hypothetical protein